MRTACSVTGRDISTGLRELGVRQGDVLLVHSSLSSFGHVVGGADTVIDALLDGVGPGGTVMVPTLTWDTVNAQNPVFDVRRTPSSVGLISEVFRQRPEALRSLHPTHSCAAIGPMREELLRGHETQITPCGSKSPYQRLVRCGGKIVFLGVGLAVNTSLHALEEMAAVPYLFAGFEMLYTADYEGNRIAVPHQRHRGTARDFGKTAPILQRQSALVRGRIGQADVRIVEAARMEAVVLPLLAEDPYFLLRADAAERARRRASDRGGGG